MSDDTLSYPASAWVPYGPDLVDNGYLVTVPWTPKLADQYYGIDDVQWPLEYDADSESFLRRMGIPRPGAGIQVAAVWEEVLPYWRRCLAQGLRARLILASTRYQHPRVRASTPGWDRLGFDVADPLGQHSATRHEVVTGLAPQLRHWRPRLNAFGLFDEHATAEEYVLERLALIRRGQQEGMETHQGFTFVPVLVHLFAGDADDVKC